AWTSHWTRTELAITGAWHRDHLAERGDDHVQIGTAYIPAPADLADDAAVAAACDDSASTDPYPLVANCPVPTGFYVRGGAGQLTSATVDTPSLTIELAHVFGNHRLDL